MPPKKTPEIAALTADPASEIAATPPVVSETIPAQNAPPSITTAPVSRKREVIAVMRVKYGAVEIEYGIRSLVEPGSLAEQNAEFDKLTAQLESAHDKYADNRLPKLRDRGSIEYGKEKKFRPTGS